MTTSDKEQPSAEGKVCPACQAGAIKTRDGRYHPGYNGKRFYACRARERVSNHVGGVPVIPGGDPDWDITGRGG